MRISTFLRLGLLSMLLALCLAHRHALDPRARTLSYEQASPAATAAHYRLDHRVCRRTRGEERSYESNVVASLGCVAQPLMPGEEAAARFEVSYPSVRVNAWEVEVDEEGETWVTDLPAPQTSDFGYEVRLGARGDIRTIKRTGARTAFPNARLYEERQNTFVAFLPELFQPIAGQRLGPGARWSKSNIEEVEAVAGAVALLRTTAHYELVEIEAATIARIAVRFDHEFAAADGEGQSVGRLRASDGTGELYFDVVAGRPLRYRAEERASYEVVDESGERVLFERLATTDLAPDERTLVEGSGTSAEKRNEGSSARDERGLPLPGFAQQDQARKARRTARIS